MYYFTSKVRYSETDEMGNLTLQAILDYFQDVSTFQSEELGVGVHELRKRKLFWVLNAWQIVVFRYPKLGETINVATFPYAFKGFLGLRNFFLEDESGNKIAIANSTWTLMDAEKMVPVRAPEDICEKYRLSPKLDMVYAPRKIELLTEVRACEPIMIKQYHLDMNHHVNNGQYIRIAMDALGQKGEWNQLRAEYKKSAFLGQTIYPYIAETEEKIIINLCDEEKNTYALVELARY